MVRQRLNLATLCVGMVFMFALAAQLMAQNNQEKNRLVRYEGRVTVFSKATSSITIQGGKGVVEIGYDTKTKFTYRNKPSSIDDVKEGRRVVCLVNTGEKGRLLAARIDVRSAR